MDSAVFCCAAAAGEGVVRCRLEVEEDDERVHNAAAAAIAALRFGGIEPGKRGK